jgi:hypothetical protein
VVRPEGNRHRIPSALSSGCAAPRGHRSRSARTVIGSVRPVRRFDAPRALADRDLPSRPKPDGGPPRAFAPVQRSIAALPHRPADRSRHAERCFLPWAFEPYDTCETADPLFAGLPAPRRAASGVWVPPSRRPPPFLPTPCGAGASVGFTPPGVLLEPIGTPLGAPCPRGVARVDSPRPPGERADAVDFRASIPVRTRAGRRTLAGAARRCLLGVHPSERSPPSSWSPALVRGASPRTHGGATSAPTASQGLAERRGRLAPLGATGSPGIPHLATVAGSFRPERGAGSWIHLTARPPRAVRADPSPVAPGPAGAEAPTRAPPSLGETADYLIQTSELVRGPASACAGTGPNKT